VFDVSRDTVAKMSTQHVTTGTSACHHLKENSQLVSAVRRGERCDYVEVND
jgi:hypothetical protein